MRPDDPVFEIIVVSYRSRDQIEGLLAGLPETCPSQSLTTPGTSTD